MIRKTFKIGNRVVSDKNSPLIIAEIGQAHDGSIEKVFKFIDKIKESGGDAAKFQLHLASEESTLDEPFRIKINKFKNRYSYWESVEFSQEEWFKISNYCKRKKIIFLSSVFSKKGVHILKKVKTSAWKIASGEFKSNELIEDMMKTKLPILFSTGMMNFKEIKSLHNKFNKKNIDHAIFQCTSNYPVRLKNTGLNVINELREKFNCQIGYSDHSGLQSPSIMALALRANLIEVHLKLNQNDKGPDASSSLDFKEFKNLCKIRNEIFSVNKNPVNKNIIKRDIHKMRKLFGKSIALKTDLKKGSIIKRDNLTMKKPGFGLSENKIKNIIGRKVANFVSSKRILKLKDIS
jgi:N,N'-diacetyllegionaminate synthase|tara:strand:- start:5438 stop:6484 length:1047 start_codon:yes stop_codon:yes gene_type:complete